ncbi:EAL domain-containing protein [Jeongeupia naejangsanensis]|uniref:EAL domain-containing protein n=1 Tax=Jeongeupia naejangsanensis TaxID=613195 RepID=A0ABS2BP66_9NEIS|nr:EAL domain-containing protein [Jeongeupia naejangsanensis]MBM3117205.1 EAL domain-containing protein [Jeongeupia naejangsanensis]
MPHSSDWLPAAASAAPAPFARQQAYFDAFDRVVAQFAGFDAPDLDALVEALADASLADLVCLYRCDGARLRLDARWLAPGAGLSLIPLGRLPLSEHPLLADTLAVGMLLQRSLLELPMPEQMLLAGIGARRIVTLPLLDRGEPFGLLAFFDEDEARVRSHDELTLLTMLGRQLAQGMVRLDIDAALRAERDRLAALVGATDDMVFEVSAQGAIIRAWSGHPVMPDAAALEGRLLTQVLPVELASLLVAKLPSVLAGEAATVECRLDGVHGPVWFEGRMRPAQGDVLVLLRDVSSSRLDALQQQALGETLQVLGEAVIDLSRQGYLVRASAAWARLRGLDPRLIDLDFGMPLLHWVHEQDVAAVQAVLVRPALEPATLRFRLYRESGELIWVEACLLPLPAAADRAATMRGVLRDVTEIQLNQQQISRLALYDDLTRLPNRLMLDDALAQAIAQARQSHRKVALGFIDLDHFKQINDAFGHRVGDQLLTSMATRLSAVLREQDLLARWGGDEFVVLMPDLADPKQIRTMAEQLRNAAREAVMLDGLEAHPSVSCGFAIFPDNAESCEELLSAADHTMYHAKHAGRNNVCFYGDILHLKALGREHVALQSRLSAAIRCERLSVFYQPVVSARDGGVIAVEALARWQDEHNGWISPDLFVPMAEKVGLIQELSDLVMQQAFPQLRAWRDAGLTQKLMLNISRSQLFSPVFVSRLVERLAAHRLRPHDVIVEITESAALNDYARQLKHLRQLASAGFQIAIDDFGTGYSSLAQVNEMRAQWLKVDVSFTQKLHTEAGRRVMQAIVQFGQGLGLGLVVEGVESLDAARYLQGLGVEYLQGFHFSEPVPAGVAELWMRLGLANKV